MILMLNKGNTVLLIMKSILSSAIHDLVGSSSQSITYSSVSGGEINQSYKVSTGSEVFFAKVNAASRFPLMFEEEVLSLGLLAKSSFRIPEVHGVHKAEGQSVLLLEWIESGQKSPLFWEDFGRRLAAMHKLTNKYFGLKADNYIGSLPQSNEPNDNWNDFFVSQRIEPHMKLASDSGLLDSKDKRMFQNLFHQLDYFFENEPPALLHGDLWSGNLMCSSSNEPVLIDPAVYYGHRLMDLGMTRLFGGFDPLGYESYHSEYPLPLNWQEAADIANLYPLLVHVNLFGSSYVSQVRSVISRYS